MPTCAGRKGHDLVGGDAQRAPCRARVGREQPVDQGKRLLHHGVLRQGGGGARCGARSGEVRARVSVCVWGRGCGCGWVGVWVGGCSGVWSMRPAPSLSPAKKSTPRLCASCHVLPRSCTPLKTLLACLMSSWPLLTSCLCEPPALSSASTILGLLMPPGGWAARKERRGGDHHRGHAMLL